MINRALTMAVPVQEQSSQFSPRQPLTVPSGLPGQSHVPRHPGSRAQLSRKQGGTEGLCERGSWKQEARGCQGEQDWVVRHVGKGQRQEQSPAICRLRRAGF